jgi:hypothetical protein
VPNSLQDVQRAWALAALGITESTLSTTDLLYSVYAGLIGIGGGGGGGTITSVNGYTDAVINLTQADIPDGGTKVGMLATERTKLSGIATGATANSSDATLLNRANHTGTQTADTITDGTTNKAFLATERTKLSGIATGATANSSDATLLNRANHTGTQAESTITNLVTDLATLTSGLAGKSALGHSHDFADLTGQLVIAQMAPGGVFTNYHNGTSWPSRPSARTDLTCIWIGPTNPTVGGSGMVAGLDVLYLAP